MKIDHELRICYLQYFTMLPTLNVRILILYLQTSFFKIRCYFTLYFRFQNDQVLTILDTIRYKKYEHYLFCMIKNFRLTIIITDQSFDQRMKELSCFYYLHYQMHHYLIAYAKGLCEICISGQFICSLHLYMSISLNNMYIIPY
jgi:hypothetical protein